MGGVGDDQPEVRISDAERDGVVELLRRHCADGRLSLDEFADRAGAAYAARSRADVEPLLADLPTITTRPAERERPGGSKRRRILAVMSAARRRGRWRVDRPVTAVAFWGSVKLDLRDAQITLDRVEIRAWAIMGSIDVVVPEGIPVDLEGFVLMGSRADRVRDVPLIPGAPTVEVRARGLWGSLRVRNPTPKDRIEQRLRARTERRQARWEERAARRGVTPPPAGGAGGPPQALPRPSLEGLIPPLPPQATEALRQVGLISALASEVAAELVGDQDREPPPARPDSTQERGAAPAPGSDRRDPAEAPPPPVGTVTVLFTDIAGSTEMAEALGDQRWVEVLRTHNALVREQMAAHDGTEVKVHGDGFMVAFASARSAILAATDAQRAMARYRAEHPDVPVEIRIGLHTGEVVAADGDYFGRNVILAARIADRAAGGEILTSSLVKELTESSGDLVFDDGEDVELKGLSRPHRVHRVEWR
jgi:class 3 adenylate cyclase